MNDVSGSLAKINQGQEILDPQHRHSIYIERERGPSEFEKLRETMLNAVQRLSSHRWSDYNLHDPGVTILEQLCYGLSDLNYRTEYSIEELFANDQHEVDLHHHGLYTPNESLVCRPVSHNDKIKYFLDAVPALASIKIKQTVFNLGRGDNACELPWLYQLTLHTRNHLASRAERDSLFKQVDRCFHGIRNLGEDLFSVNLAESKTLFIEARVYVDNTVIASCQEEELLAQLYLQAQSYLLGEVQYNTNSDCSDYKNNKDGSDSDGPGLNYLCITDKALQDANAARSLAGLIAALTQLPGVLEVDNARLWETDSQQPEGYQPLNLADTINGDYSLRLRLPESENEKSLTLVFNHRKLAYRTGQLKVKVHNLLNAKRLQRQASRVDKSPTAWPGAHKDLLSYVSIQSQFPNNYGINAFGLSAHESDKRKAQTKQLKGYLMLFDQFMSDHLGILDNAKHFLSSDITGKTSYPCQGLDASVIPGINALYSYLPGQDFLVNLEAYDNYPQRKSLVLDFLSAMNGRDREIFGWEFRNPYFSETEKNQRILENKKNHLERIHEYAENRAGAFNYRKSSWGKDNIPYIEKRLRLVLGLSDVRLSTVHPLIKCGLIHNESSMGFHLDPNAKKEDNPLATAFYQNINKATIVSQASDFVAAPHRHIKEDESWKTFHYVKNLAFTNLDNLQNILFQAGANLECYRLGQVNNKRQIELFINLNGLSPLQANWLYLMSFKNKSEAVVAANQLCFCIQQLNINMEGLHVLEHNLLLPVDERMRHSQRALESLKNAPVKNSSVETPVAENPWFERHVNQVSVILPSWSARFRDEDFQLYVNDLILREMPAHLYTHIHWVSYVEMETFEVLFKNWCHEKSNAKKPQRLNHLSHKLMALITEFEQRSES
ncbi:hypothetical protein [Teredinibacter haidensis]|uniref:hypothetical protein n=1 Tax=Teredinibacter haidensis TaxID=2731755 RepID=UPI0009488EF0|nr:hypothetical protein [Teredinibacter haidensis]